MHLELPDLTKLRVDELATNRARLWAAIASIDRENERRSALKFVWPQEESMIRMFREATNYEPSKIWVEPSDLLHAYLVDDVIEYEGAQFRAIAPGAIMTPPGEVDPTRPQLWSDVV